MGALVPAWRCAQADSLPDTWLHCAPVLWSKAGMSALRVLLRLALPGVLVLGLVACSGDESSSRPPGTPDSALGMPAEPALSGEPAQAGEPAQPVDPAQALQPAEPTESYARVPEDCSVAQQQRWLLAWMRDWYFWADAIPAQFRFPVLAGSSDTSSMLASFEALRFRGDDRQAADRWSYVRSTQQTNLYFDEGYAVGYGIAVGGQDSDPLPLRIRWVEPLSPASTAGLARGDIVESMQGRSAESWKQARDFSPLVASEAGDELVLEVRRGQTLRRVVLRAERYPVTSVLAPSEGAGWTSANGNRAAYVFFKDFIDSARQPLAALLLAAQQNQVKDLVLDLRYNGGGLVGFTTQVASSLVGERLQGEVFARLVYNARHAQDNVAERFADPGPLPALQLERLVVLSGPRTCSASELLINGIRERHPGLRVSLIGERTCGKPYGFHPRPACGLTYHAVNFITLNARGEANHVTGLQPDCQVRDEYQNPLGSAEEAMLAAARQWLDQGTCLAPPLTIGAAAVREAGGPSSQQDLAEGSAAAPKARPANLVDDGEGMRGLRSPPR